MHWTKGQANLTPPVPPAATPAAALVNVPAVARVVKPKRTPKRKR